MDHKKLLGFGLLSVLLVGCSKGQFNADLSNGSLVESSSIAFLSKNSYAGTTPALGGKDGQTGNPKYTFDPNFSFGGDGAKGLPITTIEGRIVPTTANIGSIQVPYVMSNGGGSGTCSYQVGIPGQINAATAMNITGSCQTPNGQSFESTGVMTQGFNNPPGIYVLMVGFGINGGWYASLSAVVNLKNGQVSDIKVTSPDPKDPMKGQVVIATGSSGKTNAANPYATSSSSLVVALKLSEGSVCMVTANAWTGSDFDQQTLSSNCTSPSGAAFTMVGTAGKCGLCQASGGGAYFFELEGVGPQNVTYRVVGSYNPANGQISQSGGFIGTPSLTGVNNSLVATQASSTAAVTAAHPYHLAFSGSATGACQVSNPDATGAVSGACMLSNGTTFSLKGIAIHNGNGIYDVSLSGEVNGTSFGADIDFDSNSRSGSGSWSSSDGGVGTVAAN
jgi:hypothetical protein